MSSYVMLSVLAAALVSTNAVSVIMKEAQEVAVGADARLIRSQQGGDPKIPDADAVKAAAAKGPVSINLYYETRCPDCIEFINQTLAPLWANEDLRDQLNITMNPYGNSESIPLAKVSDGYKFFHPETTGEGWDYVHISQHGSDEALGNLIQACAIEKVEQKKYMELIFCMASEPDWGIEKAAYECMDKAQIDQKTIKECVQSPHGNKLMAEFGKQTGAVPGRQGTPWVMVGGINLVNVTDLMRSACHGLLSQLSAGATSGGPKSCAPFFGEKPDKPEAKAAPQQDDTFTVLNGLKKEVIQKELVQIGLKMPGQV